MGFMKAKPAQAAIKCAMFGPPGSGKTFTSLLFAEGLSAIDGKRVAFVDTERGSDFYSVAVPERRVHSEAFDFDALYSRSIMEIAREIRKLDTKTYGVVVIDSMTHLWEAAMNSYEGKKTRAGTIPMHAWGKIKKPYKDLVNYLMSSPMHVFFLGRQGNEYAEDEETGETKAVGVKMKAEGETPYEPSLLIQMEAVKQGKKAEAIITAFAEKDRSGILSGRTIQNPTFASVIKPILSVLGGEQGHIPSVDEVATQDAEAIDAAEASKVEESSGLLRRFTAQYELAEDESSWDAVNKTVTPSVKTKMTARDLTALRESARRCLQRIRNSQANGFDVESEEAVA